MSTYQQRPVAAPFLSIAKQTSPFEERITRNGIQRDIHVVIKNSPFMVHVSAARGCDIDLNHVAFEATLLYDTEGEKGVDFVKVKPIEFKCVPNEAGDQVAVELRIKVLTSQHEDMFFKVRIQGQDPVTKQDVPHLKVITAAIKVISKPEQLKKRNAAPAGAVLNVNPLAPMPGIPPMAMGAIAAAATAVNPNSKKRTVNDMVVEAVTRIEKQQVDQHSVLDKILQCVSQMQHPVPKQESTFTTNGSWDYMPHLNKRQKDADPNDFESCFVQLLKTFQSINPNNRAEKVRRVARNLSVSENEGLAELVDMLMTEGLGVEAGRADASSMIPSAVHGHNVHKSEDGFFFTSVMPPYSMGNSLHGGVNSMDEIPNFFTPHQLQMSATQIMPLTNSHDFMI